MKVSRCCLLSFLMWAVPCFGFLVAACGGEKPAPAGAAAASDLHGDAIREMLKAPRRFKEVVATIRDEASYDRAAPGLTEVVNQFRSAAAKFRQLNPPAESEQAKYRQMIADGFHGTEPTGEDMISLVTIKSRKKEVSSWMDSFTAAGREAGIEAVRLYGNIPVRGVDLEEAEVKSVEAQMEEQIRAQKADLLEKVESKPRPEPVEIGDNPLLRHLDGQAAGDE
jgi:hypothetical protein